MENPSIDTLRHTTGSDVPDLESLASPQSALRPLMERYQTDRESLTRKYPLSLSVIRQARMQRFTTDWLTALEGMDFERLDPEAQIDWLLFRNHLRYTLRQFERQAQMQAETAPLLPFLSELLALEEERQRMEWVESAQAATRLHALAEQIRQAHERVEAACKQGESDWKPVVMNRAAKQLDTLREVLKSWRTFYHGYDPLFTWWTEAPYREVRKALQGYAALLREQVGKAEADGGSIIVGDPLGREYLLVDLAMEMIPYTPEELIEIGEKEFQWCEAEMLRASQELGFGDDWHRALEHVKGLHQPPGGQPERIRQMAVEAIAFLDDHDLLTVPPLARETWRMEMMSPAKQLVNPFFLGGEMIQVSFPTHTMTHPQKQMSLRGNNVHFARATVQHELIPGHHLQMFAMPRYRPYRQLFETPFWIEGWAIYWEFLLWEKGFPQSPEDRIGMLFWRMHRCARIVFSLRFHLEQMTPQACIEMLVERVGHERANATAEVRRSFQGDYPPLYQCAYLLGGLQMWALRRELVESGQMTERAFHDAVLQANCIPWELLRAQLTHQPLTPDFTSTWRFYG